MGKSNFRPKGNFRVQTRRDPVSETGAIAQQLREHELVQRDGTIGIRTEFTQAAGFKGERASK